jgi:lysozyme
MSRELPISLASARKATNWLMTNFGGSIRSATQDTPFSPALICALACQETAYFWLSLVSKSGNSISPDEVIARCVLDASGDASGTSRSAFPKNTAAFYNEYDKAFGDMLVAEANATRALRGMGPKEWIYKGYGIFQYDLQFVREDEDYFRFKQWHDFETCLKRVMKELSSIYRRNGGNLWETVRAYNGGGQSARDYRDNVKEYVPEAQAEIDNMSGVRLRKRQPAPRGKKTGRNRASKAARSSVLMVTKHAWPGLSKGSRTRARVTRGGEVPASKPQRTQAELKESLAPYTIDRTQYPMIVVGIRGYYRDTMGAPHVNDRGMYDDAIFIDAPDGFAAFNGNTDPSIFRAGEGFDEDSKGIASLNPGAWFVHKFDLHKGEYLALCQRAGKVTVTRDGKRENYSDTGEFGINIHRGSYHGTSSLGCQTLHPDQWDAFITMATDLARRYHGDKWRKVVIPYVLMEA